MSDDKDKVKLEIVYGFVSTRHDMQAVIIGPPGPRNAWEAAWWAWLALWHEVVYPALLFALSFTAFKFALLGHF